MGQRSNKPINKSKLIKKARKRILKAGLTENCTKSAEQQLYELDKIFKNLVK